MTSTKQERWIALTLALSVALQAAWIAVWSGDGWRSSLQWWLIAAFGGLAIYQAWMSRAKWPAHGDMLLLMAGYGGFGMMLGGWIDAGLPLSPPPGHHHHGIMWSAVFTWMTGLMLLFAVPPSALYSRCLAGVKRRPVLLAMALVLDCGGMVIGMLAAGAWWGMALMNWTGSHFAGMHLAMLAGMLGGMLPAMLLRDWLLLMIERRQTGILRALAELWVPGGHGSGNTVPR